MHDADKFNQRTSGVGLTRTMLGRAWLVLVLLASSLGIPASVSASVTIGPSVFCDHYTVELDLPPTLSVDIYYVGGNEWYGENLLIGSVRVIVGDDEDEDPNTWIARLEWRTSLNNEGENGTKQFIGCDNMVGSVIDCDNPFVLENWYQHYTFLFGEGCGTCDGIERSLDEPASQSAPPASPDYDDYRHELETGEETEPALDPVHLFSGEFYHSEEDLRIAGRGMDLVWQRKYSSRKPVWSALGYGWDFSYNVSLWQDETDGSVTIRDGNARSDRYTSSGNGTWTKTGFGRELTLQTDGTFVLTFRQNGRWEFYPLDESSPQTTQGKLHRIFDRNNNMITLEYDEWGRLWRVHDTLDEPGVNDRYLTVAYTSLDQIASVTDWTGRQIVYTYYQEGESGGCNGDLKSVRTPVVTGTPNNRNDFPDGKTTVYTYSCGFEPYQLNHNLLTITDARGHTYLQNTYAPTESPGDLEFDRVVTQTWGDTGQDIKLTYVSVTPETGNGFANLKVIMNDRVGNVREFFYDSLNNGVMEREYTGRAPDIHAPTTETANRPTGKLRSTDPDYFETRYEFNSDSLNTRVIHPNGNITEYWYESDPRVTPEGPVTPFTRGNLRELHRLPGTHVPAGDQSEIVERYWYSGAGPCCLDQVRRHQNARGHEVFRDYDSSGNLTHVTYAITGAVEDFEYNSHGQLTAHVFPDNGSGHRRRDELEYCDTGPQKGYLRRHVVDATGLALPTVYDRDARGNVVKLTDSRGGDTQFVVNQLDQIVRTLSRETTAGSGIRYWQDRFYDANNNLVRVEVQNLDENGTLPDQGPAVFTTVLEYETLNHLVTKTEQVDASRSILTAFEYDANRNPILVRFGEATNGNQPANTRRTYYDERNAVFKIVRGENSGHPSTTQYDYDGNRNLVCVRQGLEDSPRVTNTTFDGYNRAVAITDPMGNVATTHYDPAGNVSSRRLDGEINDVTGGSQNVRLSEATFVHDPMNRLTETHAKYFKPSDQSNIGDGESVTVRQYSHNSQLLHATDDNNHTLTIQYDSANRRQVVTDPRGNSLTFGYDGNDNVTSIAQVDVSDIDESTDPFVVTRQYDGLDRIISSTDRANNVVGFKYDSRGNRVKTEDARGNVTRFEFDGVGRLTKTTRQLTSDGTGAGTAAGTLVTSQTWDDSSRLKTQADAQGNSTVYGYDPLNRRISVTHADGTSQQVIFDAHDDAITATDANGTVVTSTYDLLGRLTGKTIVPGTNVSSATLAETYAYDGMSRLVRAEDDDSIVSRTFDSLGDLLAETLTIDKGQSSQLVGVTSATFDGVGNRLTLTYPGGRQIGESYDALDRRQSISESGVGTISTFKYLGATRPLSRTYLNNTGLTYGYDAVGRLNRTTHRYDPSGVGTILDDRGYTWDAEYNKIQRNDLRTGGSQTAMSYDSVGRLIRSTETQSGQTPKTRDYALDGVGNRMRVTGSVAEAGLYFLSAQPPPADLQVNQYTATPVDRRQYDGNGNLVSTIPYVPGDFDADGDVDDADIIHFDASRTAPTVPQTDPAYQDADVDGDGDVDISDFMLVQPHICGASSSTPTTITYDHRNQMVEFVDGKTGRHHRYAYDALGRRISKTVDATGTPTTTRFLYSGWQVIEERDAAGSTTATYVYGNSLDDVVTARRSGTNYYYHADDQHNVTAVTDATGAVVERYEYNDYGQPLIFDNSGTSRPASAIGNSLMFTGRAYDAETGLYYYRTRYYDPILGRFTTRDTIGTWGDPMNLGNGYAYVGNNPWTITDPMGLGSYWQDFKTGFSLVANPVSDFIGAAHDSMDNLLYDPTSTVLYRLVKGDPQTFMNTMDRTLAVGAATEEMLTLGLLNDGEQCERSSSPVYKRTKHVTEKVMLVAGVGGVVKHFSSFALRKLRDRFARDEIADLAEKIAANERAAAGTQVVRTPHPGKISGNPANRLIETGTPAKDGGWQRRWYRMTDADERAYQRAVAEELERLYDETQWMGSEIAKQYRLERMKVFRTNWLKRFLAEREY